MLEQDERLFRVPNRLARPGLSEAETNVCQYPDQLSFKPQKSDQK